VLFLFGKKLLTVHFLLSSVMSRLHCSFPIFCFFALEIALELLWLIPDFIIGQKGE